MKMRYLSAAAAIAFAAPGQTTVIVTSAPLLTAPMNPGALAPGEIMLLDFEGANPENSILAPGTDIVSGADYQLHSGEMSGWAAPPLGNTSKFLAVYGSGPVNNRGEVTIDFGLQASSFSLDIGSIDTYNSFQVFYLGTDQTWTGAVMPQVGDFGNWTADRSNMRITWSGNAGERFTAIKLISTQNSLEVDNLAVNPVPEPATWALMMLGFGLVGAAARRRKGLRAVAA